MEVAVHDRSRPGRPSSVPEESAEQLRGRDVGRDVPGSDEVDVPEEAGRGVEVGKKSVVDRVNGRGVDGDRGKRDRRGEGGWSGGGGIVLRGRGGLEGPGVGGGRGSRVGGRLGDDGGVPGLFRLSDLGNEDARKKTGVGVSRDNLYTAKDWKRKEKEKGRRSVPGVSPFRQPCPPLSSSSTSQHHFPPPFHGYQRPWISRGDR